VIDNRPGASGNLGAEAVAKSAPDGHTLLMIINTFTMTPAIYKKLAFDPIADFAPVAKLAEAGYNLAVHPNVPAQDLAGLVRYAKSQPGRLNYASPGNGTPHHLAMELFKSQAQIDVVHVPYKGIAGALTDLVGGQVQTMFATIHSMRPHAQSGRVRLLAVTGATRSPLAPDVPTFREQGFAAVDGVDAWYGVLAPAKTRAETIARLHADFVAVVGAEEVKAELDKVGLAVRTAAPAELGALIKSDLARWAKVVRDAGISAD
jgi:tripartite-type tricarboxylate transporter receptor subunit TctC